MHSAPAWTDDVCSSRHRGTCTGTHACRRNVSLQQSRPADRESVEQVGLGLDSSPPSQQYCSSPLDTCIPPSAAALQTHFITATRLKVLTFVYHHLQGNPDQEQFAIRSGVLTGNDTRWHSAISGSPLPEWMNFGPWSLQLDRPTYMYAPASCTMAFHKRLYKSLAFRSGTDLISLFVMFFPSGWPL